MNFKIVSMVVMVFGLLFNNSQKLIVHDKITSGIVFESNDGGKTWNDVSEGLPEKFDPRTVFVDKDELLLGYEKGIFRKNVTSESNWQKDYFLNEQVSRIFKSTSGPLIFSYNAGVLQKIQNTGFWVPALKELKGKFLYCVLETKNGDILVGSDSGLYKSVNKGMTWKKVLESEVVYSLVEKDNIIVGGSSIGLIRSTDKGEHWDSISKEDGPTHIVKQIQGGFMAISQGFQMGTLVGELPATSANSLRRSNDGGKTWQHIDEHLTPFRYMYKLDDRRSPVRKINDVEQYEEYIFTSIDNGVYRSADFGKTWELVLPSIENTYFDIAISGKTIFAIKLFDGC